MISAMCEKKRYFRSASAHLQDKIKCPKAYWLLRIIRKIGPDSMSTRCDGMLYSTIKSALRTANVHSVASVIVAIDKHLIPRCDKPAEMRYNITKRKLKSGTSTFETYITAKIVEGFRLLNLACSAADMEHLMTDLCVKSSSNA